MGIGQPDSFSLFTFFRSAFQYRLVGFHLLKQPAYSLFCLSMESVFSSINKFSGFTLLFVFLLSCSSTFTSTEAYDAVDTGGNITIKWDVMSWTPDGYVGVVTIYNFQKHHQIKAPGWRLGWTWAKKEIIWSMVGSQTTEQGDCSRFKGNIPHSCDKDPTVVDLSPKTPFNQQISNCCRGGVLKPWDASTFQLSVGAAGTTNETVRMPKHFTLNAPGNAYTCGPPQILQPTKFITQDKKRVTRALMTWIVICKYSSGGGAVQQWCVRELK